NAFVSQEYIDRKILGEESTESHNTSKKRESDKDTISHLSHSSKSDNRDALYHHTYTADSNNNLNENKKSHNLSNPSYLPHISYTPFLRVASPIASNQSGLFAIPRVGDEVI
ncbi:hypothetical protein CQA53_12110, partial [Helicobacter didelphidarum]